MVKRRSPFRTILSWLAKPDSIEESDLIFVLAGEHDRKEYALRLFREQYASRILFSVGRFDLRRFSVLEPPASMGLLRLASEWPPPRRHFFVYMDSSESYAEHVEPQTLGTLTEMDALSDWLKAHPEIRTMLIVSSWTHLFRLRMCCNALLPASVEHRLVATPEGESKNNSTNIQQSEEHGPYLLELAKIVLYDAVLMLCRVRARSRRCPMQRHCVQHLTGQSLLSATPVRSSTSPLPMENK
jgi:uncharacterized SAM-binding protein YcdF (DUF218 family)